MDDTPQDAAETRRKFLTAVGGWVGSLAVVPTVTVRPASATPASLVAAIGEVVGDAPVRQGKVKLELPPMGRKRQCRGFGRKSDDRSGTRHEHPYFQRKEPSAKRDDISFRSARWTRASLNPDPTCRFAEGGSNRAT